jgi:non-ribosomal peptide synthetase component E (peptide arylation enzyme)
MFFDPDNNVATPTDEHPEIILFTTSALSREEANSHLRAAGLSALHNIRRVVHLDALPVLGTGKTDYKALKELLRSDLEDLSIATVRIGQPMH